MRLGADNCLVLTFGSAVFEALDLAREPPQISRIWTSRGRGSIVISCKLLGAVSPWIYVNDDPFSDFRCN